MMPAAREKKATPCGDLHALKGREPLQMGWYTFAGRLVTGLTVLDVGAGSGEGLKVMAANAKDALGIDLDERLQSQIPRVEIRPLSSIGEKAFDAVVAIDVIEHVEDDIGFVRDMVRVARQWVFVTTPNYAVSRNRHPYHVREYVPEEFEGLFAPYGRMTIFAGNPSGDERQEIVVGHKRLYYLLGNLYLRPSTALLAKVLKRLLRTKVWAHQAALLDVRR